jgi:putative membrane protein PagO
MCLIWGSTFLTIRIGNEAVPPVWAAAIRLVIATPLYFIVARATGAVFQGGAALRAALGYGALNYGVNFVLLYWGEQRIPSGTAAVIYATIPLTTGLFASLLSVHRFERRQMLASVVGLAGVAVVFSAELTRGAPLSALAAVLGGATASSLSSVILKKGPPQSTWVANGIGAAAGAVVCLTASVVLRESHAFPRGAAAWMPIAYLVLAGNLGAYALYGWLIARWNVIRLNVIALLIPVVAVVLGSLIGREALPSQTFVGGAIVLLGVALTLRRSR